MHYLFIGPLYRVVILSVIELPRAQPDNEVHWGPGIRTSIVTGLIIYYTGVPVTEIALM
jgi:hypothetical protein